ncbi:ribosomal protein L4/L1 family [Synechococcus sp. PCC 7335]|uniref:50S ribosomal protein L4 n=1 Tax=Synechococcus sp. (strain ATCC 29403 / PCC 7335) TaxID=91464 RepID=UPI00017EE3BB|nr:50S ribosomal protein L4 [Synechococcus sp. PCC 7335]EDX83953.1 ribosomal protein L4/L1 family [Synechococcus sp. PCC 7335]
MVDCVVKNWQGEEAGSVSLELKVASEENASHIVHRALVRQINNGRQGTASTKTRAEVRGGGRKPWRQKGTGRARAGSIRSPLWRGGGVIFGPKPRDYTTKMNRKERRLALRTAFQSRANEMTVVKDFAAELTQPKTKEALAALTRWEIDASAKVLMVFSERNDNVYLSLRNVPNVRMIDATNLNIYDILHADSLVVTESALEKIQEVYGE